MRDLLRSLVKRPQKEVTSASLTLDISEATGMTRDELIGNAQGIAEAVKNAGLIGDAFIEASVLKAFQAHGLSLSYNHYYSIIPDINALPAKLWDGVAYSRAWDEIAVDDYGLLLDAVTGHSRELADIPSQGESGFFWNNPMFPPLDAIAYYGIVREKRPKKILEIGSGYSTHLAVRSLEHNGTGSISSIEPYPGPHLLALSNRLGSLIACTVQDAPIELFEELEAGDILFIDTSHALKVGSDVNYILFEVLPRVTSGVYIHIHDFFGPFEYPKAWYEEIGIIWNEQYAVMAFLMNNSRYKVILPNYLASVEHEESLTSKMAGLDIWNITMNLGGARGASLWLQKN